MLTEPFQAVCERILSYWKPDKPLPVLVMDHPMQNISQDEVKRRGQQIAEKIADYFRSHPVQKE